MDIKTATDRLERFGKEIGLDVRVRFAGETRSRYLTAANASGKMLVIRISDHADVYGRADYSVDPYEGTLAGARDELITLRGTTAAAINRLRRARRIAARRANDRLRREWVAAMRQQYPDLSIDEISRQAEILFGRGGHGKR